MTDYASAGVNVELGDDVSKILYNAARETWRNRDGKIGMVIAPIDSFSGVRAIDVSGLPPGTLMNIGFDGVGTKVEVAERQGRHDTVAFDLFAMVCDDAVVRGAEPVLVGSILDVNALSGKNDQPFLREVRELAHGYIAAANAAGVAIVNGEVAELRARVHGAGPFNYNWGAGVVWFANKDRLLTGHEIAAGDVIVGLEEKGFRSNGLSLVRKVLRDRHGTSWHRTKTAADGTGKTSTLGNLVLHPSRIYSRAAVDMFGGYAGEPRANVTGIAHITGGGLPGKLGRIIEPSGLGADITESFEPPEVMRYCQQIGNVSDTNAYKTWNMGQGMAITTRDPARVIQVADEHGIAAKIIGTVTERPGILITSKGHYNQGKSLRF